MPTPLSPIKSDTAQENKHSTTQRPSFFVTNTRATAKARNNRSDLPNSIKEQEEMIKTEQEERNKQYNKEDEIKRQFSSADQEWAFNALFVEARNTLLEKHPGIFKLNGEGRACLNESTRICLNYINKIRVFTLNNPNKTQEVLDATRKTTSELRLFTPKEESNNSQYFLYATGKASYQ